MSNLLQVNRANPKALQKDGNVPLYMEFPVHGDLHPFLVSSTRAVLWVEQAHPGDMAFVKAAVRDIRTPGEFFWELTEQLIARGKRDEWGSVHPFTEDGVRAAIAHVKFYGLDDLELLVPRTRVAAKAVRANAKEGIKAVKAVKGYQRPDWLTTSTLQLPTRPSGWVPDDCAIVVPKDRAFVGVMIHLKPKSICAAIHNASRGLGIAKGDG